MLRCSIETLRGLSPARLERHANGPRVYVLGRRIHEFHLGVVFLLLAAVTFATGTGPVWLAASSEAAGGAWLVIKDWPDLFPSTRDTACWRFGVHRPPRMPWQARERDRHDGFLKRAGGQGKLPSGWERRHLERGQAVIRCSDLAG